MFDPSSHVPLLPLAWDEAAARAAIDEIVVDALAHFDRAALWPPHPQDEADGPQASVYVGAAGVAWGLHYLSAMGATTAPVAFAPSADRLLTATRKEMKKFGAYGGMGSLLLGDLGTALALMRIAPSAAAYADVVHARALANNDKPVRELMWGTPGSMLAAVLMHERTGEARWRPLYEAQARRLLAELEDGPGGPMWTQDLYGQRSRYLGPVHGFTGNILALFKGWSWLDVGQRATVERATCATLSAQAKRDGTHVSWPAEAGAEEATHLCQWCHGAPGVVVSCADAPFSTPELEALLTGGAETVWAAGPLRKGSNLCHGTGGNGYAFLKLHARRGELMWLDRARAFAMTAIEQCRSARAEYGLGRYSLWTGDVGLAIFLSDCITGRLQLPFIDIV